MKKIGIICAMRREEEQLLSRLHTHNTVQAGPFEFITGTLNGCEIILSQSGMGKVNAALNALEMIKTFQPDFVLNSGVAGGLDGGLKTMDTVIGRQYVYHDVWCATTATSTAKCKDCRFFLRGIKPCWPRPKNYVPKTRRPFTWG